MDMYDKVLIGSVIVFNIGFWSMFIGVNRDNTITSKKYLVNKGYAIYNSEKQLVIKDEYKKYYDVSIE